ncbi:hypothetical protein EI427_24780 [Flammeovirga pectinis]|uniref:Uncharacterized protein n=1 Tax=Flammeovirga pectinis TaxID=2494373 RepID=A0A3S9PBC5_9BACT|nr:hypothetical protein [Flammeovirga pectinis]AZQ65429.1 hypothetical protein EI427_24780 [Flammeovirga pectinis]
MKNKYTTLFQMCLCTIVAFLCVGSSPSKEGIKASCCSEEVPRITSITTICAVSIDNIEDKTAERCCMPSPISTATESALNQVPFNVSVFGNTINYKLTFGQKTHLKNLLKKKKSKFLAIYSQRNKYLLIWLCRLII